MACVGRFDAVYVLFDGVDECDDDQQRDILKLINEFMTRSSLRIMLTSRPHHQLRRQLLPESILFIINAEDADIRMYLSSRLETEPFLSQESRNEIIEVISQGAEGMFLLVEFQLHRVLRERDPRRVKAALDSLPKKIADAYQDILERIAAESNNERVFKVLSWIFHAKRPILMDELRELLSVDLKDTQLDRRFLPPSALILEECKSLITHDEASDVVRFTHKTVHQFLESMMSNTLLCVVDLAKTLLTYLSFDIFQNPCADDLELKERVTNYKLCCYAARYWPEYTRGKGERDPTLQQLLFRLFQSPQHTDSLLQMEAMSVDIPEAGCRLIHFASFHQLEFICEMLFRLPPKKLPQINSESEATVGLRIDGVPVLAETFGDVHSRDAYGETPLHIAARLGYKGIVELLLAANADVNAKSRNSADMTPIHLAITRGHNEVVALLVEANADLEAKGRYAGETPLLLAAFLGRNEVVDTLLKANAQPAASIEGVGETAIMRALNSTKAIRVVHSLLKAGANVNATDVDGRTALHYSLLHLQSFKTCKQMLELLLQAGADINIPCTVDGNTPLHVAASIDLQQRQYELNLQRMEAKFSELVVNDIYAHQCALQTTPMPGPEQVEGAAELSEIVDLLLRAGANWAAINSDGETPLECAIKFRNPESALMLLNAAGRRVDFTMNSLGDHEFLEALEEVLAERARDNGVE